MYLQLPNLEDDTEVLFLVAHRKSPRLSLEFIALSCNLVKIGEDGHILKYYPIASKILSPAPKILSYASRCDLERLNNKLEEEVKTLPQIFNEGFVTACNALVANFKV